MKKLLSVLLLIALVLSFAGCKGGSEGGEGHIGDKNSAFDENASENITLDHAAGSLSMDESVVKDLLSAFSPKDLGLEQNVYDYVFKLEQAIFNGKACCRATAYLTNPKDVKGVFYIVGTECYRYDSASNKYYLLTVSGAQQVDVKVEETKADAEETQEPSLHQKTEEDINDENTQVLRARYKNYDLSVVGLTKPIDNYTFVATSKVVEATDGTKVFVIYLMENGQYTEFTFGMGTNGKDYYYDRAADEYKVLS